MSTVPYSARRADRWGAPSDFGEIAAYLADPALVFHTGDSIVIDGGYSID